MSGSNVSRTLLATALNVDPQSLTENVAIGSVPSWDSLGHMRLLTEIERHLGRDLTAEEIVSINSLNDLQILLGE